MKNKKITIIVALLLGIAGIWTVALSWADLQEARSLNSWEKATGVIISSEIAGERAPHPEIEYSYSVGDSSLSGQTSLDVAGFGTKAARRDEAVKLIAQYSPGDTVSVFYNPAAPSISTLRPFPVWSAYTRLGSGIFLVIGALIMMGYIIRKKSLSLARHTED